MKTTAYHLLQSDKCIPIIGPSQTSQNIVKTMRHYGGSFVKALAAAFDCADSENFGRLKAAFPDIWENYANMERALRDQRDNQD